jgi:hypothetical protein
MLGMKTLVVAGATAVAALIALIVSSPATRSHALPEVMPSVTFVPRSGIGSIAEGEYGVTLEQRGGPSIEATLHPNGDITATNVKPGAYELYLARALPG